jgi:hypothetical protein
MAEATTAKSSFLTLPTELRLPIYEAYLINRTEWSFRNTSIRTLVPVSLSRDQRASQARDAHLEPAILRVCKQIRDEASPILYSNTFHAEEAHDMIWFLERIGGVNVTYVRSLHLRVSTRAELDPWVQLLQTLAKDATGLRHIDIGWDADARTHTFQDEGAHGRGLGDNLDFVRALARIQSIGELSIDGYYAKPWPAYLETEMGARVQAGTAFVGEYDPYIRKESEEEEDELDLLCYKDFDDFNTHNLDTYPVAVGRDEELRRAKGAWKELCEISESYRDDAVKKFKQYQDGTEDLFP